MSQDHCLAPANNRPAVSVKPEAMCKWQQKEAIWQTRGDTGHLPLTGDVAPRLVHGSRVLHHEAKSVVNLWRNQRQATVRDKSKPRGWWMDNPRCWDVPLSWNAMWSEGCWSHWALAGWRRGRNDSPRCLAHSTALRLGLSTEETQS